MNSRVTTALLMLVPAIYLIGWSPQWLFLLVLVLLAERALYEFFALTRRTGLEGLPVLGYAACGAMGVAQWADLDRPGIWVLIVLTVSLLLALLLAMAGSKDLRSYLGRTSATVLGIFYVGFAFSCIVPIRFSPRFSGIGPGRHLLMFLFGVVWSGDIFAYLIGRALGRHLMFPGISPKKTVEGAIGGFLGSVIIGWAYAEKFWATSNLGLIIFLAVLVAVAGQIGDLAESAMKRNADVKDTGSILPGHGGILDRVDSVLVAAPAFWLALILRNFLSAPIRW
ncbi:MAG: phosphatidate cytidylyltransferase [Terriglobia bacterium]